MNKVCFIDNSPEKIGNPILKNLRASIYVDDDFSDEDYHTIFVIGDFQLSPNRKEFLTRHRNAHFFFIPLERDNTKKFKSFLKRLGATVTDFSESATKLLPSIYYSPKPFIPSAREELVFLGDKKDLGSLHELYKIFLTDEENLSEWSGSLGLVVSKDKASLPPMLFRYLSNNIIPIIDVKSFPFFIQHRDITFPSSNIVANGNLLMVDRDIKSLQRMQKEALDMNTHLHSIINNEIVNSLSKPLKFKVEV